MYVCACAHVYVCVCVCMYVCMYVCARMRVHLCVFAHAHFLLRLCALVCPFHLFLFLSIFYLSPWSLHFQDGIHLSDTVLKLDAQILLNMYCNNHMNYNDGTCCSDGEPVTVLQIITGE